MAAAPTWASRRRERGTTLTEAAFVTIPFFLVLFSIVEMGFMFRNYLTISNTAAEAGRAASVAGSDPEADFLILRAAEHGVAALGVDQLEYLVVWRATGPGDTVPDVCKPPNLAQFHSSTEKGFTDKDNQPPIKVGTDRETDTSVVAECNVYIPGDFALNLNDEDTANPGTFNPTTHFGCQDDPGAVDWGWCPQVRRDGVGDPRGTTGSFSLAAGNSDLVTGTDYVGIYVETNHQFITGFFQDSATLSATKIVRIEPERN